MESEAEAEAEVLRGEAEAFSIEARAKAEAEKMAKKADAWKEYKEAAMLDMVLENMPKASSIASNEAKDLIDKSHFRWPLRLQRRCPRPRRSRWWPTERGRSARPSSPGRC